jgi:hypothetical protein
MGSNSDRRGFARVAFQEPVLATQIPLLAPGDKWALLAHDLSETGLRLTSVKFVPVGSRLRLQLETKSRAKPMELLGGVVWVVRVPHMDQWTIGIRFCEVDAKLHQRLRTLVYEQRAAA